MMKMIVCIIQDKDKEVVSKALNQSGFRATLLSSTGAYFRKGNTTMLIGVNEDQVDEVIQNIKDNCSQPDDPQMKRATLFVMNINRFEQV